MKHPFIVIEGLDGSGKATQTNQLCKALEQKQESQEELISQLAALIIEQNKSMIGEDVAANAIEKVQEEAQKRRGRPKKSENLNEGGTKENEQEEKTKRRRATKTA